MYPLSLSYSSTARVWDCGNSPVTRFAFVILTSSLWTVGVGEYSICAALEWPDILKLLRYFKMARHSYNNIMFNISIVQISIHI